MVPCRRQKYDILTLDNTLQFLREQGADPETLKMCYTLPPSEVSDICLKFYYSTPFSTSTIYSFLILFENRKLITTDTASTKITDTT